ncbi:putative CSC1-like protein 1 [Hypsibius exemplaris]|uniref:CSC1-like protein 1 n=1 Tax=Hypsibius exemplaris TaxID=2072580 RepID=A0A1W0X1T5_HYPEX|nr:putative CSC1-like protein 1 [Hypsibius exemplaris]
MSREQESPGRFHPGRNHPFGPAPVDNRYYYYPTRTATASTITMSAGVVTSTGTEWDSTHSTVNFTREFVRNFTTAKPNEEDNCFAQSMSEEKAASANMAIGMNVLISFLLSSIGVAVFIFATRTARHKNRRPLLRRKQSDGSDWIQTFYSQRLITDELGSSRTSNDTTSDVINDASAEELGFWLPVFWFWKSQEIERRCGKSATQYLRYMEFVQLFAAIVVGLGVLVILPLNLRGHMVRFQMDFGRTTLVNLHPKSHLLWVHVVFSLMLFPLAIYFMKLFGQKFRGYAHPFTSTKTLMVEHLNGKKATEENLRQHFSEGFPDSLTDSVMLTYNTAQLMKLDERLQKCVACLKYYESVAKPGQDRPVYAKDNLCLRCCCFCCDVGVDALEYYSAKALEMENRIEEQIDVQRKTNSIFFVTFQTEEAAQKVLSRYQHVWNSLFSPSTSQSRLLNAKLWIAKLAPYPNYIRWQNLEIGGLKWVTYAILLNAALFAFLFFITSPVIILNALGLAGWAQDLFILNQIIPALLLIELGLVVGGIVKFITKRTRYHDKITEMTVAMKGSFGYTLFAQLILPTFGLTSAKALYDYIIDYAEEGDQFNWACIFLPDNGMVFVSFFIYQALFGASMNLSRVVELQMMAVRRSVARSEAERYLISQKRQAFRFNTSYASNCVLVSIVMVFAFIVPYIGPFGLFSIGMNHVCERYNIFFVNRVREVPNIVHKTAVNLFLFAVLFELLIFTFFLGIRSSVVGMGVLVAALVIYTLLFAYIVWLKRFGNISKVPIIGSALAHHLDDDDDADSFDPVAEPQNYEAPILKRYEMLRPLTNDRRQSASLAWHE